MTTVPIPDLATLKRYLSIESDRDVEPLTDALTDATDRICARVGLVDETGTPATECAAPVRRAILLQAARWYRRRNSVSGFEGFGDQGVVAVRALDPDVEDALERFRLWEFA